MILLIVNVGIDDNNTTINDDTNINKILFIIEFNIYFNNNDIIVMHNNTEIILVKYFKITILWLLLPHACY